MLHRKAAQAAEDGSHFSDPPVLKNRPPTQRADPKQCPRHCAPLWRRQPCIREVRMTVSVILAHKGRDVVTIDPAENLAQAIKLLAEKRIGAAIVLGADRRIAGIISERDIVRALADRGAAVLGEPVSGTMTRKVVTCNENETVASIMERMTAGKFRHVPVVDQGRLVGVVSIGDIVKHRVHEMERDSVAMRDYIMTA
jgi:CBS domain-containing protein